MSGFADHFSGVAAEYARYRPGYPAELFAYLAELAPAQLLAMDCATGSGQAAVALAAHFERVIATDASPEQIAHTTPHPRVTYSVAPAERSGLEAGSADLVTVAQALHWFDTQAFFAEAARVLRGGGVLAAWAYARAELAPPPLQHVLDAYYDGTLASYWPPQRRLVEEGYRSLDFPFTEIDTPTFHMEARFTLDELGGYLGTWSATQRYVKATGHDPIPSLLQELAPHWGDPTRDRAVRWPLGLRVGRASG